MRKGFYLICLWFLPVYIFSQSPQEIIKIEDLVFNSDFEASAFKSLNEGENDMLMLFVAIDPDVTEEIYKGFKAELTHEMERLKTKKFRRAKDEKKVQMIYDYVNVQVLTRYQEQILFPHLFVNGTFNCLTASAFYGFLLDSTGIDFNFRETYNHVHPVAFPDDNQIKIETTDRLSGFQYYDDNLKNKFASYLVNNKLISREEYYSKSVEELFNEYFFPKNSIDMKELAGLHYMNDALYKFDAEDYKEAFEQIKKAYFIYPSERMLAIFQFILANAYAEMDFTRVEDATFFVYISRLPADRVNPEHIAAGFSIITERLLFNSSQADNYDELFEYLEENMKEGELKDIISFNYYFYRGKFLNAQYMFRDGLEYLIKAYNYNPYNIELQSMLISTIAATFENTQGNLLVERMELYAEDMPVLAENGMFISLQMMAYLVAIEQLYDFDEPLKAAENMEKFENLYFNHPGVEIDYGLVGDAYSSAAVYHFKNYDKESAIRFLERGLKIAPENFELRYRLRSITE
jgi:hypothetical protein